MPRDIYALMTVNIYIHRTQRAQKSQFEHMYAAAVAFPRRDLPGWTNCSGYAVPVSEDYLRSPSCPASRRSGWPCQVAGNASRLTDQ
jgi:hypothetical protein